MPIPPHRSQEPSRGLVSRPACLVVLVILEILRDFDRFIRIPPRIALQASAQPPKS